MLVLARQLNERIVMPTVPATIEVVAIKPNGVRLGIEAPSEVTIFREEVLRRGEVAPDNLLAQSEPDTELSVNRIKDRLCHRLQGFALGLHLLRQELKETGTGELHAMIQRMEMELGRIDQEVRALLSSSTPQPAVVGPAIPRVPLLSSVSAELEGGLAS
jgi:carbon storage regulator CsrA